MVHIGQTKLENIYIDEVLLVVWVFENESDGSVSIVLVSCSSER